MLTFLLIKSQNLFDKENSLAFANYLIKSKQYNYATIELERIIHFDNGNDTLKSLLLKSYRYSDRINKAVERADFFYPDNCKIPEISANEYVKLLITGNNITATQKILNCNPEIQESEKSKYNLHILLMQKKWKSAETFYNSSKIKYPGLCRFAIQVLE